MALIHASQSAYRHHLPRKGQPGCRVIKRGILNRKRGGTKPRKATDDSGVISLTSENSPLKMESQPKLQNQKILQVKINPQGLTSQDRT